MIDDAHLAHGLAGDQLEPDWPPLTEEEVVAVLARLPSLGSLHAIDWRSPRPLSAAALVTTTTGRAFIKRHHRSVRDERTLAEEHRFSDAVRALGVPVPRILRAAGGESVIGTEQWVYEVQESARGTDVYREAYSWSPIGGERHALEAGAMLARLHHAAASFDAPQRSTDILVARADLLSSDDPLAAIAAQWSVRPALARYLADRDWQHEVGTAIAPWHVRAAEASRAQPPLWTHGDWHVSNLCWSGDEDGATITDVLDFGLSARTFALFDLATAIERNAIAWLDIDKGPIARHDVALALIRGYRAIRPLSPSDLDALADVLPLVHLDFALSEVDYFEGITRRREHADVAYYTFLIGHAAWFAGTEGQGLLQAIRDAGR